MSDKNLVTLTEKNIKKEISAQRVMKIFSQILIYIFLIAIAIVVIFPFYWMIMSSFKTLDAYQKPNPTLFPMPDEFARFDNYAKAFTEASLLNLFKNTVIVGVISTILSLIITVLSAFAFARLEFKGKNLLFAALLGTMMLPGELFTISNYVTVSQWQWALSNDPIKAYAVLIVPFLVSVFYIYLLKQNFMQISNELYLAAKVDGTTDLKYLWKVMIPLSLPTLISITILKMMGSWNSYIWPRLVSLEQYHLITNGIRTTFQNADTGTADFPVQLAAVTVVSIPLFLVFLFLRKYIMKGVSKAGTKG